jgi:oxygen-dependent protoporphyrinogen oxidase
MNVQTPHVVIAGAGMTGLSAAYYLQKTLKEKGQKWQITLLESFRPSGRKSENVGPDGFVMEQGPDSFLERKKSAFELAKDLGLEDQLVRNQTGQAYILHKDELLPIPEGAVMGVPTRIMPFVLTPLVSPAGKVRAAVDLVLPRSNVAEGEDRSVGAFFRHRLGSEVVDRIIEPLLSGIYAGDIDQMSLLSTFPQYAEMEKKYRSMILGMKSHAPAENQIRQTQRRVSHVEKRAPSHGRRIGSTIARCPGDQRRTIEAGGKTGTKVPVVFGARRALGSGCGDFGIAA